MTVTLNPETEARLLQRAARDGQDLNTVVESLIDAALEWEALDREEAIAGIKRGLESGDSRRVRPAEAVFADMRARLQNPE